MLMLLGLAFLYADLMIQGTDFLPDLFGYILLFIHIFRVWNYQKRYDSSLVVWAIAAPAVHVLSNAAWPMYAITLILRMVEAVFQFRLVWLLYKTESKTRGVQEQEPLMKTSLIVILVITLCQPILSLILALSYAVLVIQLLVGIGIIWCMRTLLKHPLSSYNKE